MIRLLAASPSNHNPRMSYSPLRRVFKIPALFRRERTYFETADGALRLRPAMPLRNEAPTVVAPASPQDDAALPAVGASPFDHCDDEQLGMHELFPILWVIGGVVVFWAAVLVWVVLS